MLLCRICSACKRLFCCSCIRSGRLGTNNFFFCNRVSKDLGERKGGIDSVGAVVVLRYADVG